MNENTKKFLTTLEELEKSNKITEYDIEVYNDMKNSPYFHPKYFCILFSDLEEILIFGFTQWRKVQKRISYLHGNVRDIYIVKF